MNRFERDKIALERKTAEKAQRVEEIYADAEKEKRELDEDETIEVKTLVGDLHTLKGEREENEKQISLLREVKDIGDKLGPATGSMQVISEPEDRIFERLNKQVFPQAQKSAGEQFVTSDGYKALMDRFHTNGDRFGDQISTGAVEVKAGSSGTLDEGSGAPGSGRAGGLIPIPQVAPGVVETLFQRLTIADLLSSGQSDTNTVRYVIEGTATPGAAGVAEAGTKPASDMSLSTVDEKIKKIATFLTVTDEMLEDAAQIQSYINSRLVLFVKIEEERQLLRGTSGGNEVQGLLTSRSVPTRGTANWAAGDSTSDKLFKGMNYIRSNGFVEPEWVVIHPDDYQSLRLLKDGTGGTIGQYYGGGPFLGAYGNAGPVDSSNQVTGAQDTVWGKPALVTAIIGSGTALVGTRNDAMVWRRGGLTVEATNAHASYFQTNLVAIRAEERLGLAVYRPASFVEVHFATA